VYYIGPTYNYCMVQYTDSGSSIHSWVSINKTNVRMAEKTGNATTAEGGLDD